MSQSLLGNGQIHVARVIEDATAIDATDDLLLGLAGNDGRAAKLHVTTAADPVLNSHHHVLSFLFEKPLVFGANPRIDSLSQLPSVGFKTH